MFNRTYLIRDLIHVCVVGPRAGMRDPAGVLSSDVGSAESALSCEFEAPAAPRTDRPSHHLLPLSSAYRRQLLLTLLCPALTRSPRRLFPLLPHVVPHLKVALGEDTPLCLLSTDRG